MPTVMDNQSLTSQLIEEIKTAQRTNEQLQNNYVHGSGPWHAYETIDDRLHEILADLGD